MKITTSTKIFLSVLLAVLFGLICYLGYRVYKLDQEYANANKTNVIKQEEKKYNAPETYTLFNELLLFENVCSKNENVCNKTIGTFSVGQNVFDMDVNYHVKDTKRYENYLFSNNKKIIVGNLYGIIKYKNNYLCIIESKSDDSKNLKILDKNLNLVKEYSGASTGGFKVIGDTIEFTGASWIFEEGKDKEGFVRHHIITENEGQFIDDSDYVEVKE